MADSERDPKDKRSKTSMGKSKPRRREPEPVKGSKDFKMPKRPGSSMANVKSSLMDAPPKMGKKAS